MRSDPFTLAALIAASIIPPGSSLAQTTIRPGLWESNERVTSPITTAKTERRCVTRRDIAKFMSCYLNHHYRCVCPDEAIGAGRIRYSGRCVDAKGEVVSIEGQGVFTPTTLSLTVHPAFHWLGLPIHGEASVDAHWLSATCPAGAAER